MNFFYKTFIAFLCMALAAGCGFKKGAILKSQNNQQTQVAVKQNGQEVLLTQAADKSETEGYTVYNISKPEDQTPPLTQPPQEPAKANPVKAEAKSVKAKSAKAESIPLAAEAKVEQAAAQPAKDNESAAKPQKPAVKEKQTQESVIIDKEGRLTHPWALAKEINPAEIQNKTPWFGEVLKFAISWSFVTAGEAEIQSDKIIEADGKTMYQIRTIAKSYSVIDKLFKVRDVNTSWLDFDLSKSHGYWQSVREGRYARDEWVVFDYKAKKFKVHKKNRNDELSYMETDLKKDGVFDMLTALYYIRTKPLPQKGEVYFDIVNAGKEYPLKVVVHGRETVKVKAGKFNCVIVEPEINGEGIFVSKGKSLKVWLTDDKYKMPVKMTVEVFIGSVKAELTQYSR